MDQDDKISILDPDQSQLFVGPDLGPNSLQRFSADEKVGKSKQL